VIVDAHDFEGENNKKNWSVPLEKFAQSSKKGTGGFRQEEFLTKGMKLQKKLSAENG